MKKTIIWIIIVVAVVSGIFFTARGAKNRAIIVETTKIEKGEVKRIVRAQGELAINSDSRIYSPIMGKIISLPIQDGQTVEIGQTIAQFDAGAAELAVASAKSALKTAQNTKTTLIKGSPTDLQLEAARHLAAQMRILYDQTNANYEAEQTTTTRDALEAAKTNHQNALVALETLEKSAVTADQISAADLSITAAKKSLAEAEKNLNQTTLVAEKSGSLVYTSSLLTGKVSPNSTVTAGSELFSIIASSDFYFAAEMEGEDLETITTNSKADVEIDAFSDEKYVGKVSLIENIPTTTSTGAEVYLVHLSLDRSNQSFRSGLSGDASFILESKKDVLTVPIEAISEEDNEQIVYVVDQGLAKKAVITTGLEDEVKVEVRSGLSLSQAVIVGDNLKDIKDGVKVKKH